MNLPPVSLRKTFVNFRQEKCCSLSYKLATSIKNIDESLTLVLTEVLEGFPVFYI
jgi:hypothetical protein